jgi:hypothetical protein
MERVVMKKVVWSGIVTAAAFLCFSAPSYAQTTAPGSINVTASVNAKAKLTLTGGPIVFADADPDVSTTVSATTPVTVDVKARTTAAGVVTLTVMATQDLTSGSDTIGISNLAWTAAGTGFVAGTSSTATAQTVGSWTGSGSPSGTQTYVLTNSWAYATGTYLTTLNYTLSVP